VTVDGDDIAIAPIKLGAVLPWDEVTAETFNFAEEIRNEAVSIEGIPVGMGNEVEETEVDVNVRNLSSDTSLKTSLEWELPEGWRLAPKEMPLEIVPGGSHTATFEVATPGPLYPTPVLSMKHPCPGEIEVTIEKALPLVRTVHAIRAEEAPAIDGTLSEPIWVDPTKLFFAPDGTAMTADSVGFYFAWDRENLYVGAECMESRMDSIVAAATDQDDAVYGEDCVGFFFQPEIPAGPVYQIYFNPLGTVFDQKIFVEDGRYTDADPEWNGEYEVKTARGRDHWAIEIRIPLGQLETEGQIDKMWALNFRRKQRRLQTAADWQVPISYDPVDYGTLVMK
jgi:hypothetical protein